MQLMLCQILISILVDIRFVLITGLTHSPDELYFLYITEVEAEFADMKY